MAEPGAGKSRLLESLAQQQGTSVVSANRFVHQGARSNNSPLFIDAYDELSKMDSSGIYKLLGFAHEANPSGLVISSRSSEWDNTATYAFKDFFGEPPLIVRLLDFSENEQQKIFEHHTENESFYAFQAEVARFDLESLLPNPQFLILFSDAYIQSGRSFADKRSIFSQAVEYLAKEVNAGVKTTRGSLSMAQKVDLVSEVFAKLLLSGAEGVASSEVSEDRLYPLLSSLVDDAMGNQAVLSTRLFIPGDTVDTHRPVHKIVAEYAAADYLVRRSVDTFNFERCWPVIAPNSIVRDELRGLLGWIASLGNKRIQETAIELDPYAVLANGDPSQLEPSSKRVLLKRLQEIEKKDPYFRQSDFWRRFSVAGFFTREVVGEIKPLISQQSEGHLRNLLLELLKGSPAINHLAQELRAILFSKEEGEHTRSLALSCLLDKGETYLYHDDLAVLIFEASHTSLNLAATIIGCFGAKEFSNQYLSGFFRVCAHLYPDHKKRFEGIVGSRYFVKRLVEHLDLKTIKLVLDDLSNGLTCTCGKKSFECDCRNGTSKIIGMLLDRYFALESSPYEPTQVWGWVKNLNFHENKSAEQSKSVKVLQENKELRQGIIKIVFGGLSNKDDIDETKMHWFDFQSHSGLGFHQDDYSFVVDHAFDTDNTALWLAFRARHLHLRVKAERGPDELRHHMREQARRKPAFMREWAKSNLQDAKIEKEYSFPSSRLTRRIKRRQRQEIERRAANIRYIQEHREHIESGRHWDLLCAFATFVLNEPEKIYEEFGNECIVRTALLNCLDFIEPCVPDLTRLAELSCESKYLQSEVVLYAACLERIRKDGKLDEVPINLLLALRTNLDVHYGGVLEEEREALRVEVNRLALPTVESVEQFCRHYIEPQLREPTCRHPQVDWLRRDPIFQELASELALEWLNTFSFMPLSALETLFEIVAEHGDRELLKKLITNRSAEFLSFSSQKLTQEEFRKRQIFWFIRAFYFLEGTNNPYWYWLKSDKNNVFLFHEHSGRTRRSDHSAWPNLSANKVEAILDAFFIHWPKVPLSSSWGTNSPKSETAYRFLSEIVWTIASDKPDDAIPTIKRLIENTSYSSLHKGMKSILAGLERKKALWDFEPPSPTDIVAMLDLGTVVTVEGLRHLVIRELSRLQDAIYGGEFNTAERFYAESQRLDEESCTRIIAERLSLTLEPQNITVTPEHHLKHDKRCDFTTSKILAGKRRLLVTEVKGQWHPKLYEAPSKQLYDLYAIHPDAEQQGIYLVLWFGPDEKVAGRVKHNISDAKQLRGEIESILPQDIVGLVDVFVLDLSRNVKPPKVPA